MSNWKKLPVKVEAAIAAAIKTTKENGGDELTLRALTHEIIVELYGVDHDFRDGFKVRALGFVDLSCRNWSDELKAKNERAVA